MVEMMVSLAVFSVVSMAGFLLFSQGQWAWRTMDANVRLLEDARKVTGRLGMELKESGYDENNVIQVTILDGTGINNSDILRFAVPLCVCGTSSIDEQGDIKNWGAPMTWGQAGCSKNYPLTANNKVTICHLPPGNPNNPQTIDVDVSSVNAHLAHGDWIGNCNACDPANYNNRTAEYLLNANGQLLRRVLDAGGSTLASVVFAENVTDLQAGFNAGQTMVNVTVTLSRVLAGNRSVSLTRTMNIFLRN
jgi:hypothetical protein